MKKLIRNGVYETNSSSAHSISIADSSKEFVLDSIYPDSNGVVSLTGGEYGWDWFKTNEALEKANYAAQGLYDNFDNLIELIKEQTGAKEVIINTEKGYIDHQSYGLIENNKEWLKNFIFNKNSWMFGGNDNSSAEPSFYVVNEFRDGKEIAPTFKYKLVVDKCNKTTKFLNKPTEEEIIDAVSSVLDDCVLEPYGDITENSILRKITSRATMFEYSHWGKKPIVNEDGMSGTAFFVNNDALNNKYYEIMDRKPNKDEITWREKEVIREALYEQEEYCRGVNFKIVQLG